MSRPHGRQTVPVRQRADEKQIGVEAEAGNEEGEQRRPRVSCGSSTRVRPAAGLGPHSRRRAWAPRLHALDPPSRPSPNPSPAEDSRPTASVGRAPRPTAVATPEHPRCWDGRERPFSEATCWPPRAETQRGAVRDTAEWAPRPAEACPAPEFLGLLRNQVHRVGLRAGGERSPPCRPSGVPRTQTSRGR